MILPSLKELLQVFQKWFMRKLIQEESTKRKFEIRNPKEIRMTENKNTKQYDLEDRTFEFAKRCRDYVKQLPRITSNIEYGKQLIRSSGSQAANYIEANESLSKKDFIFRIKICRKEAK